MSRRSSVPLILLVVLAITGCTASDIRAPVFEGGEKTRVQPAALPKAIPKEPRFYIVRKGDTLYSIAWRENLDYRALATWNQLPGSYTIHPGQLLRLEQPPKSTYLAKAAKPAKQRVAKVVKPRASTIKRAKPKTVKSLPKRQGKIRWRWPTTGKVVKGFSHKKDAKKGIHIAGREGQPVYAAEHGKVVYSGSGLMGYGKLIIVKHDKYFLSAYGHNRKILVKEGGMVAAGQKIAEMGQSDKGRAMLHFEIRKNGKPVDPVRLLPRR